MQLGNDNTLSAVDDEGAVGGHVRNRAKEHILNERTEILMVGIRAIELQLSLQRHAVGQSALQAFVDGIAGRIDVVVKELQYEIVSCVCNWEVLGEHLVESVVLTLLSGRIQLQEITERFQLHVKEIRKRVRIGDACEIDSVIYNL